MFADFALGVAMNLLASLLFLVVSRLFKKKNGMLRIVPTPLAEYLFYFFLDAKTCDALVGDLDQRYKLIRKKFGKGKANFWYWSQALRSTGPIAWQWFKKLMLKPVLWVSSWLVAHGLLNDGSALEFVNHFLAELTKRIRG